MTTTQPLDAIRPPKTREDALAVLARFTARAVRTFRSSPAFELDLHLDGAKVAEVSNDGRGGCHDWTNRKALLALDAIANTIWPGRTEGGDSIVAGLADGARDAAEAVLAVEAFDVQYAAEFGGAA
jgi:hypothetical protein